MTFSETTTKLLKWSSEKTKFCVWTWRKRITWVTNHEQSTELSSFFMYDVSRRRRAIKVCHIISWLSRYPTNSVETLRQDSLANKTRKKGQSTEGKRNYSRFLLKEVGMLMRGKFVEWGGFYELEKTRDKISNTFAWSGNPVRMEKISKEFILALRWSLFPLVILIIIADEENYLNLVKCCCVVVL